MLPRPRSRTGSWPSLPSAGIRAVAALATTTAVLVAVAPDVDRSARADAADAHECSAALDAGSRAVYRFAHGGRELRGARIVVQAQRGDRNAYCIRVQVDRRVTARWRGTFYEQRGERCRKDTESSNNPFRTGSIRTGFRVSDGRCLRWTYGIRSGGRWYSASVMRAHR